MIRHIEPDGRTLKVELDRRQFLTRSGAAALSLHTIGLGAILAACSGDDASPDSAAAGTGEASAGDATLRIPFVSDMQVPDPDIMYEGEGCFLMHSVYEGLIAYDYSNENGDFVPELCESFDVSEDLLTYTFHLREGVTFHDGTVMDADSWVKSFERRLAVDQGPAFMVRNATPSAPDPLTFVATFEAPDNAFLHFLACPWRTFAVSPTAVTENEVGGDLAQAWLTTHDAGTGPYTIVEFEPGSGYRLEYYEGYWGPEPAFTTIEITIVPDTSTQRLLLEQGELDLVRALSFRDAVSLETNPDVSVTFLNTPAMITLSLNPTSGICGESIELRRAIISAIDRAAVVDPTFEGRVEVTDNFIAPVVVTEGVAPFDDPYDPSILEALVPTLPSRTLDLAYRETSGPTFRQMAELIQTQLGALGLDVTVRGVPSSQAFAWSESPEDQRPDLYLETWGGGGDALHFDGALRIKLRTGAAPLNWWNYSNPELDELMDLAVRQTTKADIDAIYGQCSEILQADALYLPFGHDLISVVVRSEISNVTFNPYIRYLVDIPELTTS